MSDLLRFILSSLAQVQSEPETRYNNLRHTFLIDDANPASGDPLTTRFRKESAILAPAAGDRTRQVTTPF
jgi:hypothetical protein